MVNRTLLVAVVVCLTAVPVRLAAQTSTPRRGKWWQAEDVQHELGLTSHQVDAIEKVWRRDLDHRVELRRDLDTLQARWNDALEEGEIDDADAQKLIDQLEQARMERNKARTYVLLEMYRVLTPDQRSHLGEVLTHNPPPQ
jgi:Spy/CpxP family protein refolding chaperone